MAQTNNSMDNLETQVVNTVDKKLASTLTHSGQVKWFNNRLGYGFIKVISNDSTNTEDDIFVHQSHITPATSEYRSLSTGEYVSFNISNDDGNRQAVDVSGINGGPLMVDNPVRRRPPRAHNRSGQRPNRGPRNQRPRSDNQSSQPDAQNQ